MSEYFVRPDLGRFLVVNRYGNVAAVAWTRADADIACDEANAPVTYRDREPGNPRPTGPEFF